jgi:DNA-binding IclR family transcriptional regulator
MIKKSRIQSIDRALDVLEVVRDASSAIRAVDIAAKLQLPVATIHNIIRSLYCRGYLAQDESCKYLLGRECLNLNIAEIERFAYLAKPAEKYIKKLAAETGDTTAVYCEANMELFLIAACHGNGDLIVQKQQKFHNSMHITATGKVIIAEKGIEYFENYKKQKKPEKFTEKTIVEVEQMKQQIELYKRNHYMFCDGEASFHIASIAVPILKKDGTFVAALGQNFPISYLLSKEVVFETRAKLLLKYAGDIQNELPS